MDKKTIYIHMGMPKTGSTTIQNLLRENTQFLEKNGFCFFEADSLLNFIKREYEECESIVIKPKTFEQAKKDWEKELEPQLLSTNCNNIIISKEGFFRRGSEFLNIFDKNRYDIRIIIYLRKPAEYIVSTWAENIKTIYRNISYAYDNEIYPQICDSDYDKIIEILKHTKKENITIRPFEKEQWKNGNLIDDFLSCLNLELTPECKITGNKNITPSRDKIEIIRLINKLNLNFKETQFFKEKILNAKETNNNLKLIETVPDEYTEKMTKKFIPKLNEISELAGKDNLFLNNYPSCYGNERVIQNGINISFEESEILNDAIRTKIEKTEMIITKLENKKLFSVKAEGNHKIIKIFGIKLKFKRK